MRKFIFLFVFLVGFVQAQTTTDLETFFSADELAALERLVAVAQERSPAILEASAALRVGEASLELGGRLADALTVNVSAGLDADLYSQVSPALAISAGVDIVALATINDRTDILGAQLDAQRATVRSQTAAAFVAWVVAQESAQAAALASDASSAAFKVVQARFEIGEATVSDQLAAQSAVSSSAIALLSANGQIVVALEALSATVGLSPPETLQVIQGDQ